MNEASSKYVDLIATEKLLQEKLGRVQHAPDPGALPVVTSFADFSQVPPLPEITHNGREGNEISFPSFIQTSYHENNRVHCRSILADRPRGDLIFVHGLYEDNLQIYQFFITLLAEQGINVHPLTLPYHYERRPAASLFSGEYFWSADLPRSALAYKQAVYDVYQLYGYLRQQSGRPVSIAGFSMGGGVVLSLATLTSLDGVCAINPVCNISELVWSSTLFGPMRQDLETVSLGLKDLRQAYQGFEPLACARPVTGPERILLARSQWDQINDASNYDLLVETWQLRKVQVYKAGHLNILRVPRLAMDIVRHLFPGGEGWV